MPTGEHDLTSMREQPASIGTSSTVTVGLLITLLVVAAAAGAAHWRLGELEKARDKHEAVDASTSSMLTTHELQLQKLELRYESIDAKLGAIDAKQDRIDAKLDRWNAGVRTVRGEGR